VHVCLLCPGFEFRKGMTLTTAAALNYCWLHCLQAYANGLTASDIPSNLLDGMKCYVNISPNSANPCTQSALFLNLYMFFNIG
jgi:hypothetical protein